MDLQTCLRVRSACKHCYLFSEDARMACKSMSWDDMLNVLDSCYD